jgi:hypothetical protein
LIVHCWIEVRASRPSIEGPRALALKWRSLPRGGANLVLLAQALSGTNGFRPFARQAEAPGLLLPPGGEPAVVRRLRHRAAGVVYLMVFFPALDTASIRTGHFSYSLASPATVPRSSLHSPPSKNHLVLPMATITLHLGHGTCIRPICTRFGLFPVKLGVNLGFMVNDGLSAALPKRFRPGGDEFFFKMPTL